jgi:hypothetical protein
MTAEQIRNGFSNEDGSAAILIEIAAQLAEANELTRMQIEETRMERKRAMQDILGSLAQHAGHGALHDNPPVTNPARRTRRS